MESGTTIAFVIQISLWCEAHSHSYSRGRVKLTHSAAHYPLRPVAAGVFLTKCSVYWWIGIHVSQFRYDNPLYLAFNSHLFLPDIPSHSTLSHLFSLHTFIFTPSLQCVISLSPSPPPPPPWSLAILFLLCLHHFFTSTSTVRNCWNCQH